MYLTNNRIAKTLVTSALLTLLSALLCGCMPPHPEPPGPEAVPAEQTRRTLAQGELIGFVDRHGAHAWMGVPYAKPPVGDLRWRAPRPIKSHGALITATAPGSYCPQLGSPLGGAGTEADTGKPIGNEDCLYLNIWSPADTSGEPLPVMMWIHGGGNVIGRGDFINGAKLATEQNVVVVSLNYRLGPFGWFYHDALSPKDNPLDGSGNYGTLDQIEALHWIADNISHFGGDPHNVTIFGESAGGSNVTTLLISPLAENLFHRAIIQSGGSQTHSLEYLQLTPDEGGHEFSPNRVVDHLRSQHSALDQAESLAQGLRALDTWQVFAAYQKGSATLGIELPTRFRDGVVIPEDEPLELLSLADAYNVVPVLLGTNRDEGKIFQAFDERLVTRFAGLPLWPIDDVLYNTKARFGALGWRMTGVDNIATALSQSGNEQVYAYRWDWDEQGALLMGLIDLSNLAGAGHGLEIPFVFGYWDVGPQSSLIYNPENAAQRKQLSALMRGYWAEFARTGQPGSGRDLGPVWPEFSATPQTNNSNQQIRILKLDTSLNGREGAAQDSDLISKRLTRAAIVQEIEALEADQALRCEAYASAFDDTSGPQNVQGWESLAGIGCAQFDYAVFSAL